MLNSSSASTGTIGTENGIQNQQGKTMANAANLNENCIGNSGEKVNKLIKINK